VESVKYSPLWDFGGWGMRRNWKGDWCYNVSGNEGVKVWVDDERFGQEDYQRKLPEFLITTNFFLFGRLRRPLFPFLF
jgi:hypothetical protein